MTLPAAGAKPGAKSGATPKFPGRLLNAIGKLCNREFDQRYAFHGVRVTPTAIEATDGRLLFRLEFEEPLEVRSNIYKLPTFRADEEIDFAVALSNQIPIEGQWPANTDLAFPALKRYRTVRLDPQLLKKLVNALAASGAKEIKMTVYPGPDQPVRFDAELPGGAIKAVLSPRT